MDSDIFVTFAIVKKALKTCHGFQLCFASRVPAECVNSPHNPCCLCHIHCALSKERTNLKAVFSCSKFLQSFAFVIINPTPNFAEVFHPQTAPCNRGTHTVCAYLP